MEFQIKPVAFKIQQAVKGTNGVEITDLETERIEQTYKILNIGDACNECGNCATFCPTSGAPYQDKPKLHLSRESFDSARIGYRYTAENRLAFKNDDRRAVLQINPDGYTDENEVIKAILNPDYSARQVEFKHGMSGPVSLRPAAHMAILHSAVHGLVPLTLDKRE